ncbi:MAG: response regulator transcription factor [Nitrospira sp.]|nr:MAG: response regulator transcription factor [Nitrospira sp.]
MKDADVLDSAAELPVHMENIAEQRSGPGVILLTAALSLVHMNGQATDLCKEIGQSHSSEPGDGGLPAPVHELGNEIRAMLQVRTEAKDWEQFQIRRLIGDMRRAVLLRGFGLPAHGGLEHARIIIIMEEVGRRQASSTEEAKARFNLTDREESVVRQLSKGWTNKEIALSLGITEQTVKEHIKHIMQKTKTTTRTGILVQILRT